MAIDVRNKKIYTEILGICEIGKKVMGNMKKLWFVFLAIWLVGMSPLTIMVHATTDTTPPVIIRVQADKTSVKYPDVITFTVKATDDVSGISRIDLYFMLDTLEDNGNDSIRLEATDDPTVFIGKYKPKPAMSSGTWFLNEIDLCDWAGNEVYYYSTKTTGTTNIYGPPLEFTVIENPHADTEPPVLQDITISSNTTAYPNPVTLRAKVTDQSAISRVFALYMIEGDPNTNIAVEMTRESGDWYSGKLDIASQPNRYSKWVFAHLCLIDAEDNQMNYNYPDAKDYVFTPNKEITKNLDVSVSNDRTDISSNPPLLLSLKADKANISPPGIIQFTVTAKDQSGAGLDHAMIGLDFTAPDGTKGKLYYDWLTGEFDKNGVAKISCNITQHTGQGIIRLAFCSIFDKGGNVVCYKADPADTSISIANATIEHLTQNVSISVEPEQADITTGTTAGDMLEKIKAAKPGARIKVDCTRDAVVKRAVFETIKGTDKTVIFETGGIQWIFNGKQIQHELKDIDVSASIYMQNQTDSLETAVIGAMTNHAPSLVLQFPPNGLLPGPAHVRVKAEYAFRDYIGISNLYLYYYNETASEMDLIREKLEMSVDGFYEFDVTHNSTYVLSASPAIAKYVSAKTGGKSTGEGAVLKQQIADKRGENQPETTPAPSQQTTASEKPSESVKESSQIASQTAQTEQPARSPIPWIILSIVLVLLVAGCGIAVWYLKFRNQSSTRE